MNTVAENFKFLCTSKYYTPGSFMCLELHHLNNPVAQRHAKNAINAFMSDLQREYNIEVSSSVLSILVRQILCSELKPEGSQDGTISTSRTDAAIAQMCNLKDGATSLAHITMQRADAIYRDWDNRFNHIKELVKAMKEAANAI